MPGTAYFIAAALIEYFFGMAPALAVMTVGLVIADFLFVPPYQQIGVLDQSDVALIVSLPLPPQPARTRPAPKARPSVMSLFIDGLLSETDVIQAASVAEVTPDWKRPRPFARGVASPKFRPAR